jgi:hypothetical protein
MAWGVDLAVTFAAAAAAASAQGGAVFGFGSSIQIVQSRLKLYRSDTIHVEGSGTLLISNTEIAMINLSIPDPDGSGTDNNFAIHVEGSMNVTFLNSTVRNAAAPSSKAEPMKAVSFTAFVLKVERAQFYGPLDFDLDSSKIVGAAVFHNSSFWNRAIIKNIAQDDSGSTKVFLRAPMSFDESSNLAGSYATCDYQEASDLVPTAKLCGPLTSCRNHSGGQSVECYCPGNGDNNSLADHIFNMVPQFTCHCTSGRAGLECQQGVIELKQGFFNSELGYSGNAHSTDWEVSSGTHIDSNTTFAKCLANDQCSVNSSTAAVTCLGGSIGPLCGACIAGYYRTSRNGDCLKCSHYQRAGHPIVVIVILGVAAAALYLYASHQASAKAWAAEDNAHESRLRWALASMRRFRVKIRLFLSCTQVVGLIDAVYLIKSLPLLAKLTMFFNYLSADISSIMNLSCVPGLHNADKSMVAITAVALALVLVLLLGHVAFRRVYTERMSPALDLLAAGSFLAHPYLCTVIFGTFSCIKVPLADGQKHRFLFASMDVDCESEEHQRAVNWAIVAILLLVIGIPLAWAFEGWRLQQKQESEGTSLRTLLEESPLALLFRGYHPNCWWWALVDAMFKLCLTGFAVLVEQGSIMQLTFALVVTVLYLALLLLYSPFEDAQHRLLQALFLLSMVLTFVGSLMLQLDGIPFDATTVSKGYNESGVVALLLGAGFVALVAFVLFLWYDVRDELKDNLHRQQIRTLKEQIYSASDYDNILLAGRKWLDELTELSPDKRRPVVATCFNSHRHPEVLEMCNELRRQTPALRDAYFHSQSKNPVSPTHSNEPAADPNELKKVWQIIWLEAVERADVVLIFDTMCPNGEECPYLANVRASNGDDCECDCSLRSSEECVRQLALLSCVRSKIVVIGNDETSQDVASRIQRILDGNNSLDHATSEVSRLLPALLSGENNLSAVALGAKFNSQQVRAALTTYNAFLAKRQELSPHEQEADIEIECVQHSDSSDGLHEPLLPVVAPARGTGAGDSINS